MVTELLRNICPPAPLLASSALRDPGRASSSSGELSQGPGGPEGPDVPLLVIAGPTASGKTALALRLAKAVAAGAGTLSPVAPGTGAEIVSCDSVAVYRLMEIGTAKPNAAERAQVPHHCLDLYWPNQECTAGDYARHARQALAEIRARGNIAILTGGTGLYLRAVLEGLTPAPPRDEELRRRLRERAAHHGSAWLHRILQRLDPRAAELIHAHDVPKLIRSIEVTLAGGQPQTEQWQSGRSPLRGYRVLQLGLDPPRAELYARINARAAAMFEQGLLDETASLRERFGDGCRALGAQGYAQAVEVLRERSSRAAAIAAAQQGHRNYAKRQLTWFRRDPAIQWLHGFGDAPALQDEALQRIAAHLGAAPAAADPASSLQPVLSVGGSR